MTPHRYRMVLIALGLALAAVVAVVIAVGPAGEPTVLPEPLEEVFPAPGDAVVRQTVVEVEVPVGYAIELVVDGTPIPRGEIGFTPATGRAIWQPFPGGVIEEWVPGLHTVVLRWDRVVGGNPDPGQFEWSFRVR